MYVSLSIDEAGYVVVGVASRVIMERESSTTPSDQLTDAQHYVTTKKPNNFTITYDVSELTSTVDTVHLSH